MAHSLSSKCWLQLQSAPNLKCSVFNGYDGNDIFIVPIQQYDDMMDTHSKSQIKNDIYVYDSQKDKNIKLISFETAIPLNEFSKFAFDKNNKCLYVLTENKLLALKLNVNQHENTNKCQILYDGLTIKEKESELIVIDNDIHIIGHCNKINSPNVYHYSFNIITNKLIEITNWSGSLDKPHLFYIASQRALLLTTHYFGSFLKKYSLNNKTWTDLNEINKLRMSDCRYLLSKDGKYLLSFGGYFIDYYRQLQDIFIFDLENNICVKSHIPSCCNYEHCQIVCIPQKSMNNNMLLIHGYITNINIPNDVIYLINEFYKSYDIHIYNANGEHWKISDDEIINNSQKYRGFIKNYNAQSEYGMIGKTRFIEEKRESLLIEDGSRFIESVEKVLTEIFNKFASNGDKMSFNELKSYFLSCGKAGNTAQWYLQMIFDIDLYDDNNNNNIDTNKLSLPLIEFIDFYKSQYKIRRDDMWNDICCQGYNDKLRKQYFGDIIEYVQVFKDDIYWPPYGVDDVKSGIAVIFDVVVNHNDNNNVKKAINVTLPTDSYAIPYVK